MAKVSTVKWINQIFNRVFDKYLYFASQNQYSCLKHRNEASRLWQKQPSKRLRQPQRKPETPHDAVFKAYFSDAGVALEWEKRLEKARFSQLFWSVAGSNWLVYPQLRVLIERFAQHADTGCRGYENKIVAQLVFSV